MEINTKSYTTIYRVMSTDQYQSTRAETDWHTSKEYCQNYINKSYYKHMLYLETATLFIDD